VKIARTSKHERASSTTRLFERRSKRLDENHQRGDVTEESGAAFIIIAKSNGGMVNGWWRYQGMAQRSRRNNVRRASSSYRGTAWMYGARVEE